MDDPWGRFWERLVVDWVAVAVLGFGLQGLWFGLTSFLDGLSPELEPTLVKVSARLGVPWLVAVLLGFAWGVKRAWEARHDLPRRR